MNFDPTKPVSDKTACGKLTVKNFRKRRDGNDGSGHTRDYPFAVTIYEDHCKPWVMSIAENGNQYCSGNGYQLVNTPDPAPVPVDWEKPIMYENGKELEYISELTKPDIKGRTRLVWFDDGCTYLLYKDDGTDGGDGWRVVNRPSPPRTVTVEVAGITWRGQPWIGTRYSDSPNIHAGRTTYDNQEDAENNQCVFGPWQTLTLPLKDNDNG